MTKLPGVTTHAHRFGGVEFRLGRRELGHVHGTQQVDIPFPIAVRERLVAEGKAEPHHILPRSGWITFRLREEADLEGAVWLLRLSYDLAAGKHEGAATVACAVRVPQGGRDERGRVAPEVEGAEPQTRD